MEQNRFEGVGRLPSEEYLRQAELERLQKQTPEDTRTAEEKALDVVESDERLVQIDKLPFKEGGVHREIEAGPWFSKKETKRESKVKIAKDRALRNAMKSKRDILN